MKKAVFLAVLFLAAWVAVSCFFYFRAPSAELIPQMSTATTSSPIPDIIAVETATTVPSTTPSVAPQLPEKKFTSSGAPYKDAVAGFSVLLPSGWSFKPEEASGTPSQRIIDFSLAGEIDKDVPEPLVIVDITDLNRPDLSDYKDNKTISDVIANAGADAFVNSVIDDTFKKQFNAFDLQSLSKTVINGRTFYVISATYLSEKTGRTVEFTSRMSVSPEKVISIVSYAFADNWPRFKADITGLALSFKL